MISVAVDDESRPLFEAQTAYQTYSAPEPPTQADMSSDAVDKKTKTWRTFLAPLILYAILFGLIVGFKHGSWVWFSWHPIGMLVAFVAMAGNAALIKKIGGYDNTKMHGNLMFLAIVFSCFAWYVIYTNKEMQGKAHGTTPHGKLGALVMMSYIGIGIFGALALNPDFGMLKTNQTVRFAHRWAGRILTALAWLCCVSGFVKMNPEMWKQVVFVLPLLVAGPYILL